MCCMEKGAIRFNHIDGSIEIWKGMITQQEFSQPLLAIEAPLAAAPGTMVLSPSGVPKVEGPAVLPNIGILPQEGSGLRSLATSACQ